MNTCNNIYERVATGELPSRMVYANMEHGVFALLDPFPVAEGHITVATLACARSIDKLESPVLRHKVDTVATYAGRILAAAFPEAPYIGELTASNQIPHPHQHRVPGDQDANWVKRFAKLTEWPRLQFPADQMDDIHGLLTEGSAEISELWAACDAEVRETGEPDFATLEAVARLGIDAAH